MQVQRFRSQSVRGALSAVKASLGPEALVLSTQLVPARGWRRFVGRREVEVTASLTPVMSESRLEEPSDRPMRAPDSPGPASRRSPERAKAESAQSLPRRSVENAQAGQEIVARLSAVGLDHHLATEVAAALPPRARRDPSERTLRDALASRLGALVAGEEPLSPIEVFVGPPGVGKTTTIAKIAAQARARNRKAITLVAADGYRVGAVEQLRLYAEILHAPFLVARTAADLNRALGQGPRPMLVDTAGRSPADRGIRDLFDALSGRPDVRTHLVIAASTPPREALRILERYRDAAPDRIVLTKLDETEAIGPLVSALRASGLKVSWLGNGQRVPEDLAAATGTSLASAVFGELSMPAADDSGLEASCV
jgi:flagellar biosynthesis protein FlhF